MEQVSILVVDDDDNLRRLLEAVLLEGGYAVATSSSAEEALDMSATKAFDLVITDIGLPGMDGLAMMQVMKEQRPEVQMIVMTAAASRESAQIAFSAGAFDYQVKPFRLASISSSVCRAAEKICRDRKPACQAFSASR